MLLLLLLEEESGDLSRELVKDVRSEGRPHDLPLPLAVVPFDRLELLGFIGLSLPGMPPLLIVGVATGVSVAGGGGVVAWGAWVGGTFCAAKAALEASDSCWKAAWDDGVD